MPVCGSTLFVNLMNYFNDIYINDGDIHILEACSLAPSLNDGNFVILS